MHVEYVNVYITHMKPCISWELTHDHVMVRNGTYESLGNKLGISDIIHNTLYPPDSRVHVGAICDIFLIQINDINITLESHAQH